jgi:hypothetical protein
MNPGEYKPKQYLLIELPYSKFIMNHPEAIQLKEPVGAFIVPPSVWLYVNAEFTINQMKQSGEMTSTFAPDGSEWLDCPNARAPVRAKVITTSSRVSKPIQSPRVIQGLCGCCGDAINHDLARCDGCNKVVCLHCKHKIAGYIFCSNGSCTKSDAHWTTMREDGLKIEMGENQS